MRGEFMWPTSINRLDDDRLIVSDAHTGFISLIDRRSLKVTSFTGGNGPTHDRFNYPYAAVAFGNELVILSSMRGHILFLNKKTLRVIDSLIVDDLAWRPGVVSAEPFGRGWHQYVNQEDDARMVFNGVKYRYGYGHLHPVREGPVLRVPNSSTLLNPGPYMYFLQGVEGDGISAFFSSSGISLLVLDHRADRPDFIYRSKIPLDGWLIDGRIAFPNGDSLSTADVAREAHAHSSKADQLYDRFGWIALSEYLVMAGYDGEYLSSAYQGEKLDALISTLFKDVFSSDPGRRFYEIFRNCDYEKCSAEEIKEASLSYFDSVRHEPYVNFDEFGLVSMLSGIMPPRSIEEIPPNDELNYSQCGAGHYYDGFGPEALSTPSRSDYLSAVDIESSIVCFTFSKGARSVGRANHQLQIGWLYEDEVATDFEIQEIGGDGVANTIASYHRPPTFNFSGYYYSIVSFHPTNPRSTFALKVTKGGRQDRMLLRSIYAD